MLGAVFAISGIGKLRSHTAFDHFVDSLPALPGVLRDHAVAIAAAVVALELAALLLLILWPLAGLATSAALLATFTAVMIHALRAGTAMVCRCFGAEATPIGRHHVVRNALLTSASLAALCGPVALGPRDPASAAIAIGVGLLLGVLVTRWDDLVFVFRPPGAPRRSGA